MLPVDLLIFPAARKVYKIFVLVGRPPRSLLRMLQGLVPVSFKGVTTRLQDHKQQEGCMAVFIS